MPGFVQTNVGLFIGSFNYTGYSNRIELTFGQELLDGTVFSNLGVAHRTRLPGLHTIGMNFAGIWDSAQDAHSHSLPKVEDVLTTVISNASNVATGAITYQFGLDLGEFQRGGQVGDLFAFSINGEGTGPLFRGASLTANPSVLTTTGNGGPVLYMAAPAPKVTYLDIHVTAVSGTSPTLDLILQSASGPTFLSPTDVIGGSSGVPITQITAAGSARYSRSFVNTHTYYRIVRTVGGTAPSFTCQISVAIL